MDLVAALKNALDRGYTLTQAKQSLVNSGYGSSEIDTAIKYLTGGFGTTPESIAEAFSSQGQSPQEISEQEQIKQAVSPDEMQYMEPQMEDTQGMYTDQFQQPREYPPYGYQGDNSQKPKKPFPWTVVFLVILLIFLLLGLGLIIIFRNAIIEFFQSI